MKKLLLTCAAALTLGATSSHATVFILSGGMDPIQATTNPGNVGSGTGSISGDYDDVTNILNWTVTWSNLTTPVSVSHFHSAPPGVTGGTRITLSGAAAANDTRSGTNTISETFEGELLSGNWYANVHTQNFGGGEIRGQVITTVVPEPAASALALGGLGLLFLRRRRA